MTEITPRPHLDRRRVLGCAALFGITGPLLVACGSEDSTDTGAGQTPGETGSPSDSGGTGGGLVAAADVPVGGGVVVTGAAIVVTQPTEGEFKGYKAVCTHQGNPITSVSQGVMTCATHGSQFAIEDGANVTGPNGSEGGTVAALPEVALKVVDGQVTTA